MQKIKEFQSNLEDEFTCVIISQFQENILMFSATKSGIVQIFSDQQEEKPIFQFQTVYKVEITHLEFSSKGPFLLIGDIRGNLTLFDLYQTKILNSYSRHTLSITCVKFFREFNENFVSGSLDQYIKVWNQNKKQELLTIKNDDRILCLDISPDDSWIACGNENGKINLYEIATGTLLQQFESDTQKKINCIQFNPEEFQLVAGGKEKVLKFFDMSKIVFQGNSNMAPHEIKCLKYNSKGNKVYTIGQKFLRSFSSVGNEFKTLNNIEVPMTLADIIITQDCLYGVGYYSNRILLFKRQKESTKPQITPQQTTISSQKIQTEDDELTMIKNLQKNHNKIVNLNNKKIDQLTPLIDLWFRQGNIKGTVVEIERINDQYMIIDLLNMVIENKLLEKMNIQMASLFFYKALSILGSNYKSHNKTVIFYFNESLKRYTQEIISLKSTPLMSKCDLSRDERIKKYDYFLSLIDDVVRRNEFNKILNQYKDHQLGKLCQSLVDDYSYILDVLKKTNINQIFSLILSNVYKNG